MAARRGALTGLQQAAIECRTFGHQWEVVRDDTPAPFGRRVTAVCGRGCGKRRSDLISRFGDLLARSYNAPPDYKYTGEQMTRADWRVEYLNTISPGWQKGVREPEPDLRVVKGSTRKGRRSSA